MCVWVRVELYVKEYRMDLLKMMKKEDKKQCWFNPTNEALS